MTKYYEQLQGGRVDVSSAEQYLVDQSLPETSFTDLLGASYDDAFVWNAAGRMYDRRSSQFKRDNTWTVTPEIENDLVAQYRPDDVDYLKASKSRDEFLARKRYIQEDQEREKIIARAGGAGIATNLTLGLLDPVGIALGVATGGLGFVEKGTKAARILKNAGLVGAESLALEAALAGGNTQSEASDLVFAFGTGAVIGGGVGALSRARNGAALADEAIVADSDAYAVGRAVEAAENAGLTRETVTIPETETVTVREVDVARMEHNAYLYELELQQAADSPLTRQEVKSIKKEQDALRARIAEEEGIQAQNRTDVQGLRDNVSRVESEQAERLGKARTDIEAKYASRIEEAQAKVDDLAAKVEQATDPRKANKRLYTAQNRLDDLIRERDAELTRELESARGAVRDAQHKLNKELGDRNARSKMSKQEIEGRISKLQARIDRGQRSREAAKQLKKFRSMPRSKQIEFAHSKDGGGYEIPKKDVLYKRNVEALERPQGETADAPQPLSDVPQAPELGTVQPVEGGGTLSAARVGFSGNKIGQQYKTSDRMKDRLMTFLQDGANVPASLIGNMPLGKGVARWVQGLHTYLSNSQSYVIRGLNYHLFEAPQGGKAAKVTAAARVQVNQRKIRAAMKYRLEEGFEDYAASKGIDKVRGALSIELHQEFYKKVMLEAKYPGTYSDPGVKHAAQGVRDQLHLAGKIRKDAGEAGFENLDLDKNYVTSVVDGAAIFHAVRQHGRAKVREVLSEAYQRGRYKIKKEGADAVAEAYISRAMDNRVSAAESYRQSTGKDIDDLKEKLEEAGVPNDVIEDFLKSTEKQEAVKHMSDRARLSLEPDLRTEVNGLSAIDLFDSNLPKLLESYTIDAAGGAAMAKLGFKTREEFDEFLKATHQHGLNQGIDPAELEVQIGMIREGVDMLYGRSINKYAHEGWSRNLSRLRDITALLRLQAVGLSAIPESARAITNRGLKEFMRQVPAAATIIRGSRAQREGGKFSGTFTDPELRELDEVLQYAGEDHVIYPNAMRSDEVEEAGFRKGFGAKLDTWLAQGRRIHELTSFFRMFQGGGEKIAARSLNRNIRRWMYDEGDDLRLRQQQMDDAGWSDGFLDEMKAWVKANPATDTYEGKTINVFDFGRMPEEMRERYTIGVQRLVARDMQRAFVGETPTFMHKLLGQTITQFRSFSITSLDKQLIHDIRHDRAAGALILMWSAGLGLMAHSIAGAINMDENAFDTQNMLFGTWNRMGQTASLGIAADGLATLGLLPDDLMAAPNRYGFRSYGFNSVPTFGLAEDAVRTASKTTDFMFSEDSNYGAEDVINQWQKVIPFGKAVGINQAFNALEDELEE